MSNYNKQHDPANSTIVPPVDDIARRIANEVLRIVSEHSPEIDPQAFRSAIAALIAPLLQRAEAAERELQEQRERSDGIADSAMSVIENGDKHAAEIAALRREREEMRKVLEMVGDYHGGPHYEVTSANFRKKHGNIDAAEMWSRVFAKLSASSTVAGTKEVRK